MYVPRMAMKRVPHDSVMVVDDGVDIARCIKRFLETYGFHVSIFVNPLLALEEFYSNSDSYSLIISDYKMKDMTGFQFSESAKERNPSIKVLLSSAQDTDDLEFRKQAAAANVDGLLQKPYSLFGLIDIIKGNEITTY